MTTLANDEAGEALARSVSARLLEAAETAVTQGITVSAEHKKVFLTAYGWWRFMCRNAQGVLDLTRPEPEGRGYTIEVASMARNVFTCAFYIHWVIDNGDLANEALVVKGDESRAKLIDNLAKTGWDGANDAKRELDTYMAAHPYRQRTPAEDEQLRKLKHEAGNTYDALDHYGQQNLYPIYMHLSELSHINLTVSDAYLERLPDGSYKLRAEPANIGSAYVIHMVIALLQAANAVSALIQGDPLRAEIDLARAELGVDGPLQPARVKW